MIAREDTRQELEHQPVLKKHRVVAETDEEEQPRVEVPVEQSISRSSQRPLNRVRSQVRELQERANRRALNRGFRAGLQLAQQLGLRSSHPSFVSTETSKQTISIHASLEEDPDCPGSFSFVTLPDVSDDEDNFSGVVGSSNEVQLSKLNDDEKEAFRTADHSEWDAIHGTGSVRVLSEKESKKVREAMPERILSSRMVRRWNPIAGVNQFKAKSRWCVHGHQDVDAPSLKTFSPTPTTESLHLFLTLALALDLCLQFADVKNAFCQSDPMARPNGPIFAEVCGGLPLESDQLIELLVPVYGLLDAPREWRKTVVKVLEGEGFVKSILEPCWFTKRDRKTSKVVAMVLLEVDDLACDSFNCRI